ncbi:hypothetical protein [Saccharomonospora cyanea]|uniref:Secreted protein n=1 Tax=Saccharomonospora cyanea NA-134 TaxID=882082 RepID=H5XQT3_9PSEU|nr:hypothetical protein [Saccharomonospora cyanea]EHR60143.1 hypothetical protein SaccyDRAFT_1233 [Saccharomonospora cyanea NA-134]
MARLSTRPIGVLVSALALAGMSVGVAAADHQKVDGSITSDGDTCSWTGADTSANPPETLTVDRRSVNANMTCTGGLSATLNNNPTITFDDAAGTATADRITVTVVSMGVSCEYSADGLSAQRDGNARTYTARGVTLTKSGGGFLCPGSRTADAEFVFH